MLPIACSNLHIHHVQTSLFLRPSLYPCEIVIIFITWEKKNRRVNAMCSPIDDPKKGISPPPPFPRHPPGTLATPKNHHQRGQGGPLGSSRWTPKTCIRLGEIWVPWAGERAGEEPGVPPYVRQLLLLCPTTTTGQCPPSCSHTDQTHFQTSSQFSLAPNMFRFKSKPTAQVRSDPPNQNHLLSHFLKISQFLLQYCLAMHLFII